MAQTRPNVHDIAEQGLHFRCQLCQRTRPLGDVEASAEDWPKCCGLVMLYALPAVRRAIEPQADA